MKWSSLGLPRKSHPPEAGGALIWPDSMSYRPGSPLWASQLERGMSKGTVELC